MIDKQALTELLATQVAIDSVNPDLVPGGAGESEIAEYVAAWLDRPGIDVELQTVQGSRRNVVARVPGSAAGKTLMLNAHMDTVALGGERGGIKPVIEGNRLYGRGSYDMKGSLAAIMTVAAELAKSPPSGDVLLTAVVDEEFASLGTGAIVRDYQADAAIVTEPTALELSVAHKGFVWFEIQTCGVAAHGSRPQDGIDAIAKMGRILAGIEELDRRLRSGDSHPLLGAGSIHASLIRGGTELSTYPASCVLSVERRTVPGETPQAAEEQLVQILMEASQADPDFRADVETGMHREPFETDPRSGIASLVYEKATASLGAAPAIAGESGWMDSALLKAAGIDTVIFGPDGDGAHAATEWVDLDSVQCCAEIYLDVARTFCG
jgi:acetylornithine deacetylase/succinyl-diaminopimelate desuccinylase-like protein